jgi:hypothetical protein
MLSRVPIAVASSRVMGRSRPPETLGLPTIRALTGLPGLAARGARRRVWIAGTIVKGRSTRASPGGDRDLAQDFRWNQDQPAFLGEQIGDRGEQQLGQGFKAFGGADVAAGSGEFRQVFGRLDALELNGAAGGHHPNAQFAGGFGSGFRGGFGLGIFGLGVLGVVDRR